MTIIKLLKDIIGFRWPKIIVFNLTIILLYLALIPKNMVFWWKSSCIWKNYVIPLFFHWNCPTSWFFAWCECPACGMTRAVYLILHGDFSLARDYNKLSFIVLPMMLAVIGYNIRKIWKVGNF